MFAHVVKKASITIRIWLPYLDMVRYKSTVSLFLHDVCNFYSSCVHQLPLVPPSEVRTHSDVQIPYTMTSHGTTITCYILYPIVQKNRWFANSNVLFQSVTNNLLHGQFAMQTYVLYIRCMLHLNCYTPVVVCTCAE